MGRGVREIAPGERDVSDAAGSRHGQADQGGQRPDGRAE